MSGQICLHRRACGVGARAGGVAAAADVHVYFIRDDYAAENIATLLTASHVVSTESPRGANDDERADQHRIPH